MRRQMQNGVFTELPHFTFRACDTEVKGEKTELGEKREGNRLSFLSTIEP